MIDGAALAAGGGRWTQSRVFNSCEGPFLFLLSPAACCSVRHTAKEGGVAADLVQQVTQKGLKDMNKMLGRAQMKENCERDARASVHLSAWH